MEKFLVIFSRIDNQAKATFNGSSYDSGLLQGDPVYPEAGHTFEIQPLPVNYQSYPLDLIIQGLNSHYTIPGRQRENNPFHLEYKIVKRTYDNLGNVTSEQLLFHVDEIRPVATVDSMIVSNRYVVNKDSVTGLISITKGH
jgi:hypothetical protein